MSKEKQIEEMAHHLCWWWDGEICTFTKHECNHDCSAFLDSARLYNAGYRKQEWISVHDRLPEIETTGKGWGDHRVDKSVRVLCVCRQKSGKVLVKEGYYELFDFNQNPTWRIPGSIDSVTHWMPLPEPPKMN